MKIKILILLFCVLTILGCSEKPETVETEKAERSYANRGKLTIGVDESLKPMIEAEINLFHDIYADAKITPLYLPEKQVVEKLLANEIQTGIICRDLKDDEVTLLKDRYKHVTSRFKLAEDEIAAIVNNANPVNTISFDEMKKILSGNISEWGQVDPSFFEKTPIVMVITASSSIDRHFYSINSVHNAISPVSSYSLDTTDEVIEYVKNNTSAIGVLGGSWFYQKGVRNTDVKLLTFKTPDSKGAILKERIYREVYAITHESYTGLGTGFISFMGSQKGQLVLEKAGLTPYKEISREIKVKKSFSDQ